MGDGELALVPAVAIRPLLEIQKSGPTVLSIVKGKRIFGLSGTRETTVGSILPRRLLPIPRDHRKAPASHSAAPP